MAILMMKGIFLFITNAWCAVTYFCVEVVVFASSVCEVVAVWCFEPTVAIAPSRYPDERLAVIAAVAFTDARFPRGSAKLSDVVAMAVAVTVGVVLDVVPWSRRI
jgi:hypothetical protein